ncbi:MAG: hypothetical protein AB1468_02760 [Candidatus Micrarchaeota archaeon]
MGLNEILVGWVLPKDKATLVRWLAWIELWNIALSVILLASLVALLFARELEWILKWGALSLLLVIFLSTATVAQYLLAIEFNGRKK